LRARPAGQPRVPRLPAVRRRRPVRRWALRPDPRDRRTGRSPLDRARSPARKGKRSMTADDGAPVRLLGPGSPPAPVTAFNDGVLRVWFAPVAVGASPRGLMSVVEADAPRDDLAAWRIGIDGSGTLAVETATDRVELGGPVPLLQWSPLE